MSLSQLLHSYDVKRSEEKPDQRKEGIPLSCLLVYDSLSLLVNVLPELSNSLIGLIVNL